MILKWCLNNINGTGSTDKYGVIIQTAFYGLDEDGNMVQKIKIFTEGIESTHVIANNVYNTDDGATS